MMGVKSTCYLVEKGEGWIYPTRRVRVEQEGRRRPVESGPSSRTHLVDEEEDAPVKHSPDRCPLGGPPVG